MPTPRHMPVIAPNLFALLSIDSLSVLSATPGLWSEKETCIKELCVYSMRQCEVITDTHGI